MACMGCGHFRNRHESDEFNEPCGFPGCSCEDYEHEHYRCMTCGQEFEKLKDYDGHKLEAWNLGRCPRKAA
jgi:DNA-directed RNA polymerase subunit RPC12/RpoP